MTQNTRLRIEIAQKIASRIAWDCCPWSQARTDVLLDVTRTYGTLPASAVPDSHAIETAVREQFALYDPEAHQSLLQHKRRWALRIMRRLDALDIFLTGAVLNGCAHEDSNITFAVFNDDVKEVEIELMNQGIEFEAVDFPDGLTPAPLESLGFLVYDQAKHVTEGVRIDVFPVSSKRLNPYKKTPDPYQSEWETLGRINLTQLAENMHFND